MKFTHELEGIKQTTGRKRAFPGCLTLATTHLSIMGAIATRTVHEAPCTLHYQSKSLILLVPQEGFEPPTHALRMRCSTPELLRLSTLISDRSLAFSIEMRSAPGASV